MKRILTCLLAVVLALSALFGCDPLAVNSEVTSSEPVSSTDTSSTGTEQPDQTDTTSFMFHEQSVTSLHKTYPGSENWTAVLNGAWQQANGTVLRYAALTPEEGATFDLILVIHTDTDGLRGYTASGLGVNDFSALSAFTLDSTDATVLPLSLYLPEQKTLLLPTQERLLPVQQVEQNSCYIGADITEDARDLHGFAKTGEGDRILNCFDGTNSFLAVWRQKTATIDRFGANGTQWLRLSGGNVAVEDTTGYHVFYPKASKPFQAQRKVLFSDLADMPITLIRNTESLSGSTAVRFYVVEGSDRLHVMVFDHEGLLYNAQLDVPAVPPENIAINGLRCDLFDLEHTLKFTSPDRYGCTCVYLYDFKEPDESKRLTFIGSEMPNIPESYDATVTVSKEMQNRILSLLGAKRQNDGTFLTDAVSLYALEGFTAQSLTLQDLYRWRRFVYLPHTGENPADFAHPTDTTKDCLFEREAFDQLVIDRFEGMDADKLAALRVDSPYYDANAMGYTATVDTYAAQQATVTVKRVRQKTLYADFSDSYLYFDLQINDADGEPRNLKLIVLVSPDTETFAYVSLLPTERYNNTNTDL